MEQDSSMAEPSESSSVPELKFPACQSSNNVGMNGDDDAKPFLEEEVENQGSAKVLEILCCLR